MTAAIPAASGGSVASSGGNSGQNWLSTGITQNADGSTVILQFPTNTLAATQPVLPGDFKVNYATTSSGTHIEKDIQPTTVAVDSGNLALALPTLGNYDGGTVPIDKGHLNAVRFVASDPTKALVNKDDANIKYMSAVSEMNAPQVFGDFTTVSNYVTGDGSPATSGTISITLPKGLNTSTSDLTAAAGDFVVQSYAGGPTSAPLTLTTSGTNNETLNIAATFANAVPNASPVAVSYTKDTTPALKFADVAGVATAAVATTSKTASSIALAGGGSSTPAESGTSIASVTKVDATHIDVKFSGNLTPSSSSIEAGDFTVTGNTVTGAAYKNNAADTVTLTLGSALATSGTVSVGYDGASGDASKKLKFEGSFSNQTVQAGPAAKPSSGTTAMSLDVAPTDGLKVVGNKVEVKFSGALTNLEVGNAQELADFEVYYRDPGADSNLFTADDTIEAAIPTAVAAKGSDSIEMTFSSGDAAKITDNTLSGFEFFGNNGSVTDGSNQLTVSRSAKDVALSVRGDMKVILLV